MNLSLQKLNKIDCISYEEATALFQVYRDINQLGSSKLPPVIIYSHGEPVAHISYNGRVWMGNKPYTNDKIEILVDKDTVKSFYTYYKNQYV